MSFLTDSQLFSVFELFDADGCGFIEVAELPLALQALGLGVVPPAELDGAVLAVAGEGATRLSFDDFKGIAVPRAAARNSSTEAAIAFEHLDRRQRGFVDLEDLMAAARDLGDLQTLLPLPGTTAQHEAPLASKAAAAGDAAGLQRRYRKIFGEFLREAAALVPSVAPECPPGAIDQGQWNAAMRAAAQDKRHRVLQW
jgi:hypothetical protein